jgi:RNA recognition motif-containing protein
MVKELQDDASDQEGLSAFQIKERKQRTLFVGNVPLDANLKQIKKLFKVHGKVEKVWFRSVATT